MMTLPRHIPVSISPAFWIMAGLLGFFNTGSFLGTVIWMGIIFISVLVHEFGHALTASLFGLTPRIELAALGGLTYHQGEKLPFWKQFFIVLNGPLFGVFLYLLATFLLQFSFFSQGTPYTVVKTFQWINLFWTILNLLPILPMDGGQLLRILLEGFFGLKGFKYSLLISTVISVIASLVFFLYQAFLVGALFFLFAYQSYESWRSMRHLSPKDRNISVKTSFQKAEEEYVKGNKHISLNLFEQIRNETKEGMLFDLSTQYVALIKQEEGNSEEAYTLLLSIVHDLSDEALSVLHRLAFERKNYALVIKIGAKCYQFSPSAEIALRNAYAHAATSQAHQAIGWLTAAWEQGVENLPQILQDPIFDTIRTTPDFNTFLKTLPF